MYYIRESKTVMQPAGNPFCYFETPRMHDLRQTLLRYIACAVKKLEFTSFKNKRISHPTDEVNKRYRRGASWEIFLWA